MNAVFLLYLVFALALLNWTIGVIALKCFLTRVPVISGPLDLERFAALVRGHMLQALLQAGLLIAGMLLGIFVLADGQASLPLVIALNGAILVAGWIGKPLEERARALQVADPLLEERFKAICVTWVKKPFPDF